MEGRKRVLVAEQTRATRDMLAFLLANRGYVVAEASTGREALLLARSFSPDLVVLGAEFSDLPGTDLYQVLKSRQATASIPILLLVAFADTRWLPDAEFRLSKPFTAHDFLERATELLAVADGFEPLIVTSYELPSRAGNPARTVQANPHR